MTTYPCRVRLFTLVALIVTVTSPAIAETTQCTAITSLPYIISTSGSYCLTGDLSTSISSGSAITINANSVTLDMNGHKIAGASAGAGTNANGIAANNRRFIVVRNGNIRGFLRAVYLAGTSSASIIEDVTAESNLYTALRVECAGCIVRRNLIVATGGTTANGPSSAGVAIAVFGSGNVIRENDISTVTGVGGSFGYGVLVNPSDNTLIESNRIANTDRGVYAGGSNILVSDNRFMNMPVGIQYTGSGKYRNNLSAGVTTLATGGTDAGGNN